MNKMIATTMVGFILMALHLLSQVEAQNSTAAPMNTTMMANWTTGNGTGNGTVSPTDASVCVHANTLTVLVSLALTASSFLHGRV